MKNWGRSIGIILLVLLVQPIQAQKVDSIYFHLYTDSLKKGFYNYINVDGKTADGTWLPLNDHYVTFSSNAGSFRGNDLFIDSSYSGETVCVKATLKSNPAVWKEVIIAIRKRPFADHLQTEKEVLEEIKQSSKKEKRHFS